MNGRWSWLALGVGAYLAFAMATFPASTAVRWLAPPGVMLSGIQGTLWSGSAGAAVAENLTVSDLRWRLRGWSLLLGRLSGHLEARLADGFISTDMSASTSRVQFTNLRGGASLPALANALPLHGMRGQASVQLVSLVIVDGWPARVVGEMKIGGLEVAPLVPGGGSSLLPLGDYTVTFVDAPEGRIAATFVDTGGPLEVSGNVALEASREYMLDALIKPRTGAAEQLVEGLKFMTAEPDAEGRRRLTLTGSL